MFASNALILALAGLAAAGHTPSTLSTTIVPHNGTVVTVTKVYTAYTTVCPEPTQFDFNGHHYSVSEACTLTITDCPCTVTETTGPFTTSCMGWGSGGKVIEPHPGKPTAQPPAEPTKGPETCTGPECEHEVVTGGAGAYGVSLGLAAALGLLVL